MLLCFIHPWTIASPLDRLQTIDFSFYKMYTSVTILSNGAYVCHQPGREFFNLLGNV